MEVGGRGMVSRAREVGGRFAVLVQCGYAFFGPGSQLIEITKGDRVGWAGLCAGRLYAILLGIVAQRAFKGAPVVVIACHYAKGTGGNAIAAAITDIGLQVNIPKLIAYHCSRRASL